VRQPSCGVLALRWTIASLLLDSFNATLGRPCVAVRLPPVSGIAQGPRSHPETSGRAASQACRVLAARQLPIAEGGPRRRTLALGVGATAYSGPRTSTASMKSSKNSPHSYSPHATGVRKPPSESGSRNSPRRRFLR
jgi:hypothetical protein